MIGIQCTACVYRLTEDEGIHTMDSEDDELGNAVPRQTEILKSVSYGGFVRPSKHKLDVYVCIIFKVLKFLKEIVDVSKIKSIIN